MKCFIVEKYPKINKDIAIFEMEIIIYAVNTAVIEANTIIKQHKGGIEQTVDCHLLDIYFLNRRQ
jgi:hypothetical protein